MVQYRVSVVCQIFNLHPFRYFEVLETEVGLIALELYQLLPELVHKCAVSTHPGHFFQVDKHQLLLVLNLSLLQVD